MTARPLPEGPKLGPNVPGLLAFFDAGGVSLYLQQSEEVRPNSCLYFAVEGRPGAIDAAYDALKQRDVPVDAAP